MAIPMGGSNTKKNMCFFVRIRSTFRTNMEDVGGKMEEIELQDVVEDSNNVRY